MGRHIQSGTRMDVAQDVRDVSLANENVVVSEQEQNFEGRSTNTQLQLQIAVSETVRSSNLVESLERKDETAKTDIEPGCEEKQILIAEMTKPTKSEESVTARDLSTNTSDEFRTGAEPPARRRLSIGTGSTSSRVTDAEGHLNRGELVVETKTRDEQTGASANNKRPAVSSPTITGSPVWWDANRLADPRETKRSGELMHRPRRGGIQHASTWPSFSRWESINCETRAQQPYSVQCSLIDVRLDGISDDSTSSMQIDPVPMSRSREASPEPTVISFEESQELVHRQSLGMRTKHHRTRPASAPRPVNDSVATCSQPDFLSWKLQIEKRNQERHGRTPPDRDFAERYNFDIHSDSPLKGRWEWEKMQQP
ncbi:protein MpKRP [Marchantia polymorpha subsp. ruderalis]|uniref:Cyclin-dependent kinase inhibitor domain-containing protein n=2 Tax=Marchantia polymorpha TaxID=3197 RepID=A0AAF6AVU9_MARPO|nr:hypothetical protein MARPO_0007s0027 [Marchantia polymorpha]BBN03883.1 hypothetical protein Mp_3g00300 [Marchantia polymorpha subsp. ruderalis]|eukprot:PTQ47572.1 hypothetical protein MARPO_0007s0027 [Marchantia polymorpha]